MTASISDRQRRLIDEGHRLHKAIAEWGRKHGVRAYRVLTDTEAWFGIWDPKTKTISRNFPAKITQAILANAEALKAYADDTWSRDGGVKRHPLPPPRVRFCQTKRKGNSSPAR